MEPLHRSNLPDKTQIAELPRFQNISADKIILIQSLAQAEIYREALQQTSCFGFDSESKPTFKVDEPATGPHVIQLATLDHVYLFQMNSDLWQFLQPVLANPDQIKAGFGLKNDKHLLRKKGIELRGTLDLSKCFKSFGIQHPLGVKNAMALLFQVNFPKSKKISTSNWAARTLSQAQIGYAAAYAYASILILQELWRLGLLRPELKQQGFEPQKLPLFEQS